MKERLEAVVYGRVQMVMFRDFVQRNAQGLRLTGEVQNLANGTVRVVAEGAHASLEALVEKLRKGPWLAQVQDVRIVFMSPEGTYTNFTIRYE